VEWLIAAGHHPRASATTLRVAEDLADRMDYDTGHVRYCLDETAARLGMSVASVKRHVKYLRELGALAWVQHGTRANVRRVLGLSGYAATATVYAAVIPPCFDHAMGHRIIGAGYGARVIVAYRRRPKSSPAAATQIAPGTTEPVDNPPVDNSSSPGLEPPSLTWVEEEGKVKVVGGSNYTPRSAVETTSPSTPNRKTRSNSQSSAARRSPEQVRREIQETRLVRALVNWTQTERIRRLSYVLRPFFDRGLRAHDIAAELLGMAAGWRPKRPGDFIEAALAEQTATDTARDEAYANAVSAQDSRAWQEFLTQRNAVNDAIGAAPERTDDDRRHARLYGWNDWAEVADHYDEDPDDALDLYGRKLCVYAVGKAAQLQEAGMR
jgi:hypothetical protein